MSCNSRHMIFYSINKSIKSAIDRILCRFTLFFFVNYLVNLSSVPG